MTGNMACKNTISAISLDSTETNGDHQAPANPREAICGR